MFWRQAAVLHRAKAVSAVLVRALLVVMVCNFTMRKLLPVIISCHLFVFRIWCRGKAIFPLALVTPLRLCARGLCAAHGMFCEPGRRRRELLRVWAAPAPVRGVRRCSISCGQTGQSPFPERETSVGSTVCVALTCTVHSEKGF